MGDRTSITLLGSTGSIGTQALDVVRANSNRFAVTGLAAGGGRLAMLADQLVEFGVRTVAVPTSDAAAQLEVELAQRGHAGVQIKAGPDAATDLAGSGSDVVLNGMTGAIGLHPTLAALAAGSRLALANKESLIIGGALVTSAAAPGQIVPVDSEHSALAQCLRAGRREEVAKLVLTASGGPFRGRSRAELTEVTPAAALAHPTWAMGPVVTTNSATLVNKGLELIEAQLLFNLPMEQIAVMVHPQSVVHSWVEFNDGSCILQASPPDMRLPIALALGWPERVAGAAAPVSLIESATWTFDPLDDEAFPAVQLARWVGERGGTYPCVYNAANEVCVEAFLNGRIGFLQIVDTISAVVAAHTPPATVDLEKVLEADAWARTEAARRLAAAANEVRA